MASRIGLRLRPKSVSVYSTRGGTSGYENENLVRQMLKAQGYVIGGDNRLTVPEGVTPNMAISSELIPHCPVCGRPMTMNLRCDDTFVEDEGWHRAAERYEDFLRTRTGGKILFLELGVGYNTPVIIKYPFWQMTAKNPEATYACINQGQAVCPQEIEQRSICMNADIGQVLQSLSDAAIQ